MFWNRRERDAAIEAHIPALRRFALTLVRERHSADDLVQDTLLAALSNWAALRQPESVKSWLFAILYRKFLSDERRERGRGEHSHIDEAMALATPPMQEQALAQNEALRALTLLPHEQRTVLWLVAIEDLAYADVAKMLGLPLGTVMSRLARGRERLRQILEGGAVIALRKTK